MSKRALAYLTQWFRKQYNDAFSCVLTGNIFGPFGDFDPSTAPLVNALIAKADAAASAGSPFVVMGSGAPLRQVMVASDLARACIWAVMHYDNAEPIFVVGEEVSIRDIAEAVCRLSGYAGSIVFDTSCDDGPLRRTADSSRFKALCPGFTYTPLAEGIKDTISWYRARQMASVA